MRGYLKCPQIRNPKSPISEFSKSRKNFIYFWANKLINGKKANATAQAKYAYI